MICQAMYGNGAVTGMEVTNQVHRSIRRVRQAGRTVFCAGAAGATTRGTAAFRFAITTRLATGTTTAACAWRLSHSYSLAPSFVPS